MGATIKITKGGIFNAAYYLLIVFITIQIAIGSFLIILCESVKFSLLKYFHEIQKNELNIRMYLIEFYSLHLIIFYLCGYLLASKCLSEPYTEHLQLLLKFWNTLICLLSFEGLFTAWLCQESFDSVAQSIEISLYRGIDSYYENSNWRLIWDNLQFHNQCCGVKDYHDWEAITWMEYEMKTKSDKALMNMEYVSLTPYSCCKIASTCYENLFTDNQYDERTKQMQLHQMLNTNVSVINRMGCLDELIVRVSTILDITIELAIVAFIIQFVISVLMAFVFVTNRTFRRDDNSDDEFGGSDCEDQCTIGRYVTKAEDLREKYCAAQAMHPHRFISEVDHRGSEMHHRHRQSHHLHHHPPHQHHLHVGHYGSVGHLERHGSHYDIHYDVHRGSSLAHDGDHRRSSMTHDGDHRRSSLSHDGDQRRSSLTHDGDHRRSSMAHDGDHRRSSLAHDSDHRRSSLSHDGDQRRSSLTHDGDYRRSSMAHDGDHRRSSSYDTSQRRSSVPSKEIEDEIRRSILSNEHRRSSIPQSEETRRSTVHYSAGHLEEEPRRSSFYHEEESGRFSRRHHNEDNLQRHSDSVDEFRQSALEPSEELRRSALSYEQRHSNASGEFRHSALEPSEELRRSALSYEQRHSNASGEFRHSALEPSEEFRSSTTAYEQRHSNASADNTNRRSNLSRSNIGERRSRSTES